MEDVVPAGGPAPMRWVRGENGETMVSEWPEKTLISLQLLVCSPLIETVVTFRAANATRAYRVIAIDAWERKLTLEAVGEDA